MPERKFGDIPGHPEGTYFESRAALSHAGIHRPLQAGISGSAYEGADSIVLSGGYEDDQDLGFEIVYTGHGGRDPETGEQASDQELTRGNMALVFSMNNALPVRVVRGANHTSPYSPKQGYRYDGLYSVVEYWEAEGRSGHRVFRYRLKKVNRNSIPWLKNSSHHVKSTPARAGAKPKAPLHAPDLASLNKKSVLPVKLDPPAECRFVPGDKVNHPTFGAGIVSSVLPYNEDFYIVVGFDAGGTKKLLASKANLTAE